VTDEENKEEAKAARILSVREHNKTEKNEGEPGQEDDWRHGYYRRRDYDDKENEDDEDDEDELNEAGLQSKAGFSADALRTRTSSWEIS
jgi:hypothetical protein